MTDWTKLTRGERNNNPGNIRLSSSAWIGKKHGYDAAFETFESPFWGIRALARLLWNYQHIRNLNTVREIINRWAPPNENDTGAYVHAVSTALCVRPDDYVRLRDITKLHNLTHAIIHHENGRVMYGGELIHAAVLRAYS